MLSPRLPVPLAVLLVAASLTWVPLALVRVLPIAGTWPLVSAQAFLPYVIGGLAVVVAVGVMFSHWSAVAVAMPGLLLLGLPLLGRGQANAQPAADGRTLVVATSNVKYGGGDQVQLMELLRRERVDVLALQENTHASDRALRAAGLRQQFPVLRSEPDADGRAGGLAIASRWPISVRPPAADDHRSLGGVLRLPDGVRLAVRSVHPPPPFSTQNLDCWTRCTRAFASTLQQAPLSILAGDFNATLDHRPLRGLLSAGYRDAADQVGAGLRPTWHRGRVRLIIDHVLVSPGIAVRSVTVHRLRGSDHDVVIARLTLPRTLSADA